MTELETVKLFIGEVAEGQDDLLTALLEHAQRTINSLTQVPNDFKSLKIEAVVIAFNQRGADGNKSQGSGGFSTTWAYTSMTDYIRNSMPAPWAVMR